MKTAAISLEGFWSRVYFLFIVALSCLAIAAWTGMTAGCGSGDSPTPEIPGGEDAGGDDDGSEIISSVPVLGFEDGAALSAKGIVLAFDTDMKGILTPEHFSLTDASGNPISLEFDWLDAKTLRILAPLPGNSEFNLKMFSTPQVASLSVKQAASGALLDVGFKTGPNTFHSGFAVGDIDGDDKADLLFHQVRGDLEKREIVTKAELLTDVLDSFGSKRNLRLSDAVGSWALAEEDLLDYEGNPDDTAQVKGPVTLIGDVTGDGNANAVIGMPVWVEDEEEGKVVWEKKDGFGIFTFDEDGDGELIAQLSAERWGNAFGADLTGDGVNELVVWGFDFLGEEEVKCEATVGDCDPGQGGVGCLCADPPQACDDWRNRGDDAMPEWYCQYLDGKVDLVAANIKGAIERAAGDLPVTIDFIDITAAILNVPADFEGSKKNMRFNAAAPIGDINGDGKEDIAISYAINEPLIEAPARNIADGLMLSVTPTNTVGTVEIYLGGWGGTEIIPGVFAATAPDIAITGGKRFGFSIAGGDDVNGVPSKDEAAIDDLVIGEPGTYTLDNVQSAQQPGGVVDGQTEEEAAAGKAHLFLGDTLSNKLLTEKTAGSTLILTSADADVAIEASSVLNTGFGWSVLIADVIAPAQFADVVVGDPSRGHAYVFAGCRPGDDTRLCPMEAGDMSEADAALIVKGDLTAQKRGVDGSLPKVAVTEYSGTVRYRELGRALFAADLDNSGWKELGVMGGTNRVVEKIVEVEECEKREILCTAKSSLEEKSDGFMMSCAGGEGVDPLITEELCEYIPECSAAESVEAYCESINPFVACPKIADGFGADFVEVEKDIGDGKTALLCEARTTGVVCDEVADDAVFKNFDFSVSKVFITDPSADPDDLNWCPTRYERRYVGTWNDDAQSLGMVPPDTHGMFACVIEGGVELESGSISSVGCLEDGWLFRDLYVELMDQQSIWKQFLK